MAANAGKQQPGRGPGRRFEQGASGNPAGRAAGARNRASLAIDALLEGEGEAITRKVIERALEGDAVAMKLAMERIAPVRRGRPVRFTLAEVATAGDVSAAIGSVLQAVSAGTLTPEEAQTVASVLEVKRRAVETTDLEARLAALEAATGAGVPR